MSLRSEVIRIVNELLGNSKKISDLPAASALTGTEQVEVNQGGTSARTTTQGIANLGGGGGGAVSSVFGRTGPVTSQSGDYTVAQVTGAAPKVIQLAASDESSALTTGISKITFRMPYAMTLTAVRASLTVSQYSGNILTVDINNNGSSVLSTKLTIDNMEETSTTAVTPAVISSSSLLDDTEITIDIDQVGDGSAIGLKITLLGT